MRSSAAALAALALLPLWGCNCGGDSALSHVLPKIELSPQTIAFGEVPLGAKKHARVSVQNKGTADLMIGDLEITMPFSASAATMRVPPGATTTIDLVFVPPGGESATGMVMFSGVLTVHSNASNMPAPVTLTGTEVKSILSVRPVMVDLSNVAVGTQQKAQIFASNSGIAELDGTLSTSGFARPEHFSLSALPSFSTQQPIAIPPRSDFELDLVYRPIDIGPDNGRILIGVCGDDCGVEVEVTASAVAAVLQLDPPVVDFGKVGIGQTASKPVTVKNTGQNPINVIAASTTGGADLSATPSKSLPTQIPPSSSMSINLDFKPSSAAMFMGELVVRTDDPMIPQASTRVIGSGEGPLFVVQPSTIDFGVVRQASTGHRSFLLLNVGSADVRVQSISIEGNGFALGVVPGLPARIGSGESLVGDVDFSPTAMGAYMGKITVATDDPNNAAVPVPLQGGFANRLCQLDAGSSRINFGLLPVGFSRQKSVVLTNQGTDVCRIMSGTFRAPIDPALALGSMPFPVTLMPGQQIALPFSYSPMMAVESLGNFVMVTDDPVFPERHLLLEGSALEYADIFVQPRSIDFGALLPGCSSGAHEVRIFNAGTMDGYVDSVTLTSSNAAFSLPVRFNTPGTVPGGGSLSLSAEYRPVAVRSDMSAIEIAIRDHPYPVYVPMMGAGTSNPRVTDTFQQAMGAKVDVLFVMGNTQRNADLQPGLLSNIRAFIQQTNVRMIDFHIGVTSTNVLPVAGLLVGPVLTRSTVDVSGSFQQEADIGAIGDDDEEGLEAMSGAFQLAASGTQPNASLFRPDAKHVIVIITDDDDTSPLPVVSYYNALRNHSPHGFLAAVVSGQAGGCGDQDMGTTAGGAGPAPRYEEFVRLTRGLSVSECGDWSTTLSQVGVASFGLNTRFFLSKNADTSKPMTVEINGVSVPSSMWHYDSASASVEFTTPPPEGATITIDYAPAC